MIYFCFRILNGGDSLEQCDHEGASGQAGAGQGSSPHEQAVHGDRRHAQGEAGGGA